MSDWELIDYIPEQGLKVFLGFDEESDSVLVKHEQTADSLEEILNRNKSSQADGFDKRGDMWHGGHIPIGVIFEWLTKYGVDFYNTDHRPGVIRLLNSNEYSHCRANRFII